VETSHVSTERLMQVISNEDATFTQEELDHLNHCDECFNKWAECISNVSPDEPDNSAK
jgi:hypothetical protein